MTDLSKPLPPQSSVLDQFDLELDGQYQQQEKSVANRSTQDRQKVITISAIPVIDTPIRISPNDIDALDIPILTTLYSTHQNRKPADKAETIRGAKAS